jgi:hypothetical protein
MEATATPATRLQPVDLLATVSVLAVSAALILPMIDQARENARRTQCANHLKALGLALHAYREKHRVFPPGIVSQSVRPDGTPFQSGASPSGRRDEGVRYVAAADGRCPHPQLSQASAFTLILPFLERSAVADVYNHQLAGCAPGNLTAVAATVEVYLCPSNPRRDTPIPPGYHPGPTAPTDYALSAGGAGFLTAASPYSFSCGSHGFPGTFRVGVGPFNVNSDVSLRSFRDGSTTTFMLGEAAGGIPAAAPLFGFDQMSVSGTAARTPPELVDTPWAQGYIPWSDGVRVAGGLGSVFAFTAHDAWYDVKVNLAAPGPDPMGFTPIPMNLGRIGSGFRWTRGSAMIRDLPAGTGRALNRPTFVSKPVGLVTGISVSGFRSYHAGGAHFLMGDGSTRFLSDQIDPRLFVSLGSISGRETIPPSGWSEP